MTTPTRTREPNAALVRLRENAGLSQDDLGRALNDFGQRHRDSGDPRITKKTIGRWERGEVTWPSPFYRRLLADYFGVPVAVLGFRHRGGGETMPEAVVPTQAVNPDVAVLSVAIAIVVAEDKVLLTRRSSVERGISWQFPAGVVKPGVDAEEIAVRETLGETGVHCRVARPLGTRVHPVTGTWCSYFLCDYLAGVPENRDPDENSAVTWAPVARLVDFIPNQQIYPPVLEALGESA